MMPRMIPHLPFLTHPSTASLPECTLSSTMVTACWVCTLAILHAFSIPSLVLICPSAIAGNLCSYFHSKSETFRIVTGKTTQPAPIPTASGTVARRKIFLFLETMLPVIAATSTYKEPGISFSPLWGLGASDAIVPVKLSSRWRAESIKSLTLFSAAAT
jgi:hypothetical protein